MAENHTLIAKYRIESYVEGSPRALDAISYVQGEVMMIHTGTFRVMNATSTIGLLVYSFRPCHLDRHQLVDWLNERVRAYLEG